MMKLKCCGVLVESTETATAPRLFNQLALDSPPSLRHGGGTALQASKPTVWTFEERCVSVPGAAEVCLAETCFAGGIAFPSTDGSPGLQPQALEPVANGRVPGVEVIGHRSDGGAFLDHLAQAIGIDLPPWGMAGSPDSHQPVLLQLVADRRRVLLGQFADGIQRHSFNQAVFKPVPLHRRILTRATDRTLRSLVTPQRARCGRCVRPGQRARD